MPNNNAQHLQEIEAHLDRLIESLKRGELPVNLQRTKEVFDPAVVAEVQRLSIPIEKFIAIYNDVPNLFSAYAIDATITANSYDHADSPITLERMHRGNYWILPLAAVSDNAWLVPNPLKKTVFDRSSSVNLCFDLPENSDLQPSLVRPALVTILPTTPLTWKLKETGIFGADVPMSRPVAVGNANSQIDEAELERMVSRMINARMGAITSGIESRLSGLGQNAKQQAAQLIDRVKGQRHEEDDPADRYREGRREAGNKVNNWKKSLTDFISPKDD
jgi:hypothetical protein